MARERLSGGSTSFQNVPPPSTLQKTPKPLSVSSSRLPLPVASKPKRAVLGERIENFDHATPRQHVVKPVKSASRVKLLSSVHKSTKTTSPSKLASTQSKTKSPMSFQSSTISRSSPTGTAMSTPAGADVSKPGHTPHPRRSSVGLGHLVNADESMLMDMTGRDFLISDSETSEVEEDMPRDRPSGRGVVGAGRLMTPENSQETRVRRKVSRHHDQ